MWKEIRRWLANGISPAFEPIKTKAKDRAILNGKLIYSDEEKRTVRVLTLQFREPLDIRELDELLSGFPESIYITNMNEIWTVEGWEG